MEIFGPNHNAQSNYIYSEFKNRQWGKINWKSCYSVFINKNWFKQFSHRLYDQLFSFTLKAISACVYRHVIVVEGDEEENC